MYQSLIGRGLWDNSCGTSQRCLFLNFWQLYWLLENFGSTFYKSLYCFSWAVSLHILDWRDLIIFWYSWKGKGYWKIDMKLWINDAGILKTLAFWYKHRWIIDLVCKILFINTNELLLFVSHGVYANYNLLLKPDLSQEWFSISLMWGKN